MQFQVPQFIDTEPKIVGPLTLKQFMYLGVAAGFSFLFFFIFSFLLWLIITTILAAISVSLAFVKVNGQKMPTVLRFALGYFFRPHLYLWKNKETVSGVARVAAPPPQKSRGALKNLLLSMATTTKPIEKREKSTGLFAFLRKSPEERTRFQVLRHTSGEKEVARRVDYR